MKFANKNKNYKTSEHLTYSCQYHVIFCPKYRRKIFKPPYDAILKEKFYRIAAEHDFEILEMEVRPDHIHLIVDCNPRFGIVDCITKLKYISAHEMRREYPEFKRKLPTLWTRNVFISTAGDVSLESVKKYVEDQKNK